MKKFILLLTLAGCSSNWVQKDYASRSGVVSYLDQGAGMVVDSRRKDAMEKMKEFCGGEFTIQREVSQSQYAGNYQSSNTNYSGSVNTQARVNSFGSTASGSANSQIQGNSATTGVSFPVYQNYAYLLFQCN
jgi:hypothetical protein